MERAEITIIRWTNGLSLNERTAQKCGRDEISILVKKSFRMDDAIVVVMCNEGQKMRL